MLNIERRFIYALLTLVLLVPKFIFAGNQQQTFNYRYENKSLVRIAVGNHSIGVGAIGGMLSGVLGVVFIPVLYILFQSLHEMIIGKKKTI